MTGATGIEATGTGIGATGIVDVATEGVATEGLSESGVYHVSAAGGTGTRLIDELSGKLTRPTCPFCITFLPGTTEGNDEKLTSDPCVRLQGCDGSDD